MNIRNILIISMLLLSLGTAFGQRSKVPFQRNSRQQRVLDESIERIAKGEFAGSPWSGYYYGESLNWILNRYTTKEELFQLADEHPSAEVRRAATICIINKYKGKEAKECFYRHVVESDPVSRGGGCIVWHESMGDYLIEKAVELHFLSKSDWKTLDSILLASPQATRVKRRNRLLNDLYKSPENADHIRQMASQGFDIYAVIWLAARHKEDWSTHLQQESDTTLVLGIIDSVCKFSMERNKGRAYLYRTISNQSVYLASLWRHPAFERRLEVWRDSMISAQGTMPQVMFEMALMYDCAWCVSFVEESLRQVAAEQDESVRNQKLRKMLLGLRNAQDRAYNYDIDGIQIGGCRPIVHVEIQEAEARAERDKKIAAIEKHYWQLIDN